MEFIIEDYSNVALGKGVSNSSILNQKLYDSIVNTADKLEVNKGFKIPVLEFKELKPESVYTRVRRKLNVLETKYKSNEIEVKFVVAVLKDEDKIITHVQIKRVS